MIILKIGGSILTEKDSAEPKVDYENLNRIAEEIRESLYAIGLLFTPISCKYRFMEANVTTKEVLSAP